MSLGLCLIDNLCSLALHKHLLRVGLVLGEVLNVNIAEVSLAKVHGDVGCIHSLDLHPLHQLTAKVQACSRGSHSTFVLGKDGLETVVILFRSLALDIKGKRSFTKCIQGCLELIVRTVIEESQGTAT